jgi:hypothetical protein
VVRRLTIRPSASRGEDRGLLGWVDRRASPIGKLALPPLPDRLS